MVNTNYRNLEVLRFLTNKSGLSQLTLTTDNSAIPIINYGDNTGLHGTGFSKNYADTTLKTVSIFSNQIKKISGITLNTTNPVQFYNELDLLKLSRLYILNFNNGVNTKLHSILFRNSIDISANNVTNFTINTTAINGLVDYSGQFNIAGVVGVNNNPNLNFINQPIKKTSGNVVSTLTFSGSSTTQNLLGNLDLSLYDYITGAIVLSGIPNLYNIIFPSVTNSLNNGSHVISANPTIPRSKMGGVLDISSLLEFGQISVTDSSIRNIYFPNHNKKLTGIGVNKLSGNNLLGAVDMSGVRYYDDLTFDSYNMNFLFFGRQVVVDATFKLDKNNNILGTLDLEGLVGTRLFSSTINNDYMFYLNCNSIIFPSSYIVPPTLAQVALIGPNGTAVASSKMSGVIDLSGFTNMSGIIFNQSPRINNILFPNNTYTTTSLNLAYINTINFRGGLDISGIKNLGNLRLYDAIGATGKYQKLYSQLRYIHFPLNYQKNVYDAGLGDVINYNTHGTINISNLIDAVNIAHIGNVNQYTIIYPQQGVIDTANIYINDYISHVVDLSGLQNFLSVNANSKKSNVLLPNNISINSATTGSYFIGAISGQSNDFITGLVKNSELTGLVDLSGITKLNGSNVYRIAGHTSTADTAYIPASGGVTSTNPLTISTISLRTAPKLNFLNNPLKTNTTSFDTTDNYYIFSGGLQGTLDLTNFIYLGSGSSTTTNAFHIIDCPNLNTVIFHSDVIKSGKFSHFLITNNGLVGVFDIRQITNLGGSIQISNNPYISEILFPTSYIVGVNNITLLNITLTSITSLDLSNMQHIGKTINISNNALLTSVTFPGTITGTAVDYLVLNNNNLTGTLNISNFTSLATTTRFECANNVNLTNLTLPTANITNFVVSNCNLNITFPFGTTIKKLLDIQVQNNIMSTANVDATIDNIFNNRGTGNVDTATFNNTVTKTLNISGSNSAPTGTYAMPVTGYIGIIHDKTDAEITTASAGLTINEKVLVLVNLKISNVSAVLRYKLIITTT